MRDLTAARAYEAETALFRHNPHPDIPRGRTLPPNAGVRAALDTWASSSYPGPGMTAAFSGGRGKMGGGSQRSSAFPSAFQSFAVSAAPSIAAHARSGVAVAALAAERLATAPSASMFLPLGREPSVSGLGSASGTSAYVPRDAFKLYHCKPGQSELTHAGTKLFNNPLGPIRFEEVKYQSFVAQRTHGGVPWRLSESSHKL